MRALLLAAVLLLGACTAADDGSSAPAPTDNQDPTTVATSDPTHPARPARFEVGRAMGDVRRMAGRIGPRLATGPAYRRAAALVAQRFRELGYQVTVQRFDVPAGSSWGVPVPAGTSMNVVAHDPGFDPAAPHLLIGAHLDTVAVAPGAEDNASGIAVLLELARLASLEPPRLPAVFVAFGAEEPVGSGDALHHFGSRHYVRAMAGPARRSLRAMVSLDRVGVGRSVPVCTGPLSPPRVQDALLASASRLGIPAHDCELTTSDHWSFEKAGYAVARLGSTPYPAYHSGADVPSVVEPAQLRRVGRLAWAWLRTG